MNYRDPPFSVSNIMETLFPEVIVAQRQLDRYGEIEVYPEPLPNGKRAIITYHEDSHRSTQRFTVAHELGHWLFDFKRGTETPSEVTCGVRHPVERRADRFAAELLVPLAVLHRHVKFDLHPDRDDEDAVADKAQAIQRMASRFNVSLLCMKNRVRDLARWRNDKR